MARCAKRKVAGDGLGVPAALGRLDSAHPAAMETRLTALIADVKSDLMKWSFVFWCQSSTSASAQRKSGRTWSPSRTPSASSNVSVPSAR